MDLIDHKLPDTIDVHLETPNGDLLYGEDDRGETDENKPFIIGLHLPQSEAMRQYDNKIHRKTLKAVNKRNSGKINTSLEEVREENLERLVAYTSHVKNVIYNKEKITKDNIYKVYADPNLGFIKNQLEKRLEGYSSFLGES